ncbi:MAG TPA: hypothetical protein VMV27_06730 [Candidatus Binataceae bacterium]|nr:hypothetical protein [Candidatus Binataceae bacterium]
MRFAALCRMDGMTPKTQNLGNDGWKVEAGLCGLSLDCAMAATTISPRGPGRRLDPLSAVGYCESMIGRRRGQSALKKDRSDSSSTRKSVEFAHQIPRDALII